MKFQQDTLGKRVLLKPYVQMTSKGGIDLSAVSARTQAINTDKGEVVLVGPAVWYDQPAETRPKLNVGDKVYYSKYGCKTIRNENQPDPQAEDAFYIIANDEDILVGYTND